jgi:hypothetical protein
MLRLLLDEHISPKVAAGLLRRRPRLTVHAFTSWESGAFLGQPDSICLEVALKQGLTLVTYDRRTIPPLLKQWIESGKSHAGVIFVDEKTIRPDDVGSLIRALTSLVESTGTLNWTNRIVFLQR